KIMSRIRGLACPAGAKRLDDLPDTPARHVQAVSRIDQKISSPALFRIRYLPRENHLEFFHAHARPRKDAVALYLWIAGDDDHNIDAILGLNLEKKRNVEKHDFGAGLPV